QNSLRDTFIRIFAIIGYDSPPFFLSLIFLLLLGYHFQIFPVGGRLSATLNAPTRITGLFLVDSLLTGNVPVFVDALEHMILPGLSLALLTFGIVTRLTRSSMIEVLQNDY